MKPAEIATLAFRILGVCTIVLTFQQFQSLGVQLGSVAAARSQEMGIDLTPILIGSIVPILLCFALATFLIAQSKRLGTAVVSGFAHERGLGGLTLDQAQWIAYSLLGAFLFIHAIPDVFRAVQQLMSATQASADQAQMQRRLGQIAPYLIGLSVQMILGALLFFKAKGITKLWHWLQTAGTTKETEGNQ